MRISFECGCFILAKYDPEQRREVAYASYCSVHEPMGGCAWSPNSKKIHHIRYDAAGEGVYR